MDYNGSAHVDITRNNNHSENNSKLNLQKLTHINSNDNHNENNEKSNCDLTRKLENGHRLGPVVIIPRGDEQQPVRNLVSNNETRRLTHFRPSLTPGLGTMRMVQAKSRKEMNLKLSLVQNTSEEAFQEWLNAIRQMARLGDGIPASMRHIIWSQVASRHLAKHHVDWDHVLQKSFSKSSKAGDEKFGIEITKDLHRTGSNQFESDKDLESLERVLIAYCRWNKRVGYCQGFNVIAAGFLNVFARDEKQAFKIMVYLIDYVLPECYFSQNLQALSVDIALFHHLLEKHLPQLADHLKRLQHNTEIDQSRTRCAIEDKQQKPNSQTTREPPVMNVYLIQWFLTLFATCLAPDAVLRVWDSILIDGSEIILRTSIVIMEYLASRLQKLKSADQFYSTMNQLIADFSQGKIVSSQELLFEVYALAPFPYPQLKELRQTFMSDNISVTTGPSANPRLLVTQPEKFKLTNLVNSYLKLKTWKLLTGKNKQECTIIEDCKQSNSQRSENVCTIEPAENKTKIETEILKPSIIQEHSDNSPKATSVQLMSGKKLVLNVEFHRLKSSYHLRQAVPRSSSIAIPGPLTSENNKDNNNNNSINDPKFKIRLIMPQKQKSFDEIYSDNILGSFDVQLSDNKLETKSKSLMNLMNTRTQVSDVSDRERLMDAVKYWQSTCLLSNRSNSLSFDNEADSNLSITNQINCLYSPTTSSIEEEKNIIQSQCSSPYQNESTLNSRNLDHAPDTFLKNDKTQTLTNTNVDHFKSDSNASSKPWNNKFRSQHLHKFQATTTVQLGSRSMKTDEKDKEFKLPLSKTRKQFGEQFGMYKEHDIHVSPLGSGFSHRLHFIQSSRFI